MKCAGLVALGLVAALAHGARADGMTARFGLTYGLWDQTVPDRTELAPMIALGLRAGPFVGEVEYAYLSFFDPNSVLDGNPVQRLGVTLRADLLRRVNDHCRFHYACTRGTSIYGEAGAAERFGRWQLDANTYSPPTDRQPEVHVGLGLELDNRVFHRRDGWQIGLRFALARRDELDGAACRSSGSCTTTASQPGGLDKAIFIEWMFLVGG